MEQKLSYIPGDNMSEAKKNILKKVDRLSSDLLFISNNLKIIKDEKVTLDLLERAKGNLNEVILDQAVALEEQMNNEKGAEK